MWPRDPLEGFIEGASGLIPGLSLGRGGRGHHNHTSSATSQQFGREAS